MEGPFSDKNGTRDKECPKISKKRPRTLFDGLRTRLGLKKVQKGTKKGLRGAGDARDFFEPKSGEGIIIPKMPVWINFGIVFIDFSSIFHTFCSQAN